MEDDGSDGADAEIGLEIALIEVSFTYRTVSRFS